jgi:sec-independent protein translocase protein TatC
MADDGKRGGLSGEPAKDEMPAMGFLDHLEELRKRLIYCVVAMLVGFLVCWSRAGKIYNVVQRPIIDALKHNGMPEKLVVTSPVDLALYLAGPLPQREALCGPLHVFDHRLVFSRGILRLQNRISQGDGFSARLQQAVYADDYGARVHGSVCDRYSRPGRGLRDANPGFFLALMGVVSAGWMWRNFRYSVLAIFIIAAILTPTADIMNMCIFAAPMIVLYLLSIGIAYMVHPKQRQAREAREARRRG